MGTDFIQPVPQSLIS